MSKDITISQAASALQTGYFLFTGSVSDDGCPIIFSLDGIYPEPSHDDQRSALIYIASLPTFSTDSSVHYYFVVDRRKSTWACARRILSLINEVFTRSIKQVVLIQPNSFFQRNFNAVECKKLEEEFPAFQIVLLNETEALIKRFGVDVLCEQLGGSIKPGIQSFIQQRVSIDSLECNCVDLEERVKDLLLMEAQNDFDIPNDVASTEALLNEHAEVKNNLSDEISNIKGQGEILLKCFREEVKSLPAPQQMLHIQEIQRLTARLEDLEEAIRDYWEKEEAKLQDCMRLREFHEEFKSLQQNLNKLSEALSNVKDYINSVDEANSNIRRLSKINAESENLLSRAKEVAKEWTSRLTACDDMTQNTVRPKCDELLRLYDLSTEMLQYKQTLAEKQHNLFTHLDEARLWLDDNNDALLADDTELTGEETLLSEQLKQIECQLAIGKFLELLNFDGFIETYRTALSEKTQSVVEDTYQKAMELMARYEFRRSLLMDELARLAEPVRLSKLKMLKGKRPSLKRDKSQSYNVSKENQKNLEKNLTTKTQTSSTLSIPEVLPTRKGSTKRNSHHVSDAQSLLSSSSNESGGKSNKAEVQEKASLQQTLSNHEPTGMFYLPKSSKESNSKHHADDDISIVSSTSGKDTEKVDRSPSGKSFYSEDSHEMNKPAGGFRHTRRQSLKVIKDMFSKSTKKQRKSTLAQPNQEPAALPSGLFERSLTLEEEENMARIRSKLISNLIRSEEKYVSELEHIIEFYMKPIAEAGDNVPVELYTNQALLFSNLEEIYDFSSKIFLHEIQENMNSPSLIGATFKTQCNYLLKYKDYCSSRSRAEVLLRQLVDDPFLVERYTLQGHKTKLCAQLLTPAKRIISYKIFLQSMMENLLDDEEAQRDISHVLSTLSDTVRAAESLIHQVNIDGYDEFLDILSQVEPMTHGALLHQGHVQVTHDKKNFNTKAAEFKAKAKSRQLFMFEKYAVLCKIHEDSESKLRPYSFLHAIKLSVGCIEMLNASNRFILRSSQGSYLVQFEQHEQKSWEDNLNFLVGYLKEGDKSSLLSSRGVVINSTSEFKTTLSKQKSLLDDDEELIGEDPDINMFELDTDIINHNVSRSTKERQFLDYHEIDEQINREYILAEDLDNDLLLGRGDVVECISVRRDMMEIRIPGTGITSWLPSNVLLPYN